MLCETFICLISDKMSPPAVIVAKGESTAHYIMAAGIGTLSYGVS